MHKLTRKKEFFMVTNSSLDNLLERIGEMIYTLRQQKGEKLDSVSQSIGISHTVLSQVEHGRYKPLSFKLLEKIAAYYNKSVVDIISS